MKIKFCFAAAALFSTLVWLTAQESDSKEKPSGDKAEVLPGHSMHGEAFNEGPRQRAYLMQGMPKIDFPISTQVPQAQEFFNQGVGQLHGYWYFEAERSFRQVAALDTNCPMPFWGMAMANVNNEKRAKEFIKKAEALKGNASRHEVLWMESLANYYKDTKKDNKPRRREYVRSLENIVQEFPEDFEAKAFLVNQIYDNNNRELPISSHQAVDALLNEIFEANPMHPSHHFRIHLWDNEKPIRALEAAARCGQSSSGIAHMWHMPGHTYSKLHRYADAAWQQEASARVDHAHMMRDRVLPDQIHNYAHNNEWLIRDLNHIGRVQDAIDLAKNMIELPRHPKFNTVDRGGRSASYGRGRLLETLVRYELWDELIALSDTMYLEPTEIRAEQIKRLRALGLAYFAKDKIKKAGQRIAQLEEMLKTQREERFADAEKAEAKAKTDKQPEDKIAKAMADAMQAHAEKIRSIESALAELKGCDALADDDFKTARKHFEEVKDLAKDRLARLHLQMGDKEKARTLAREAVESATNQVQVLASYVEILYRTGQAKEAEEAFQRLRTLSSSINLGVPVFKRLEPFVKELGLPADWRLAAAPAHNVGERPDLKDLGPFRWQPSSAPDWNLPDANGHSFSLAHYRGKAVVVMFYLGHGCLHCMEQLKAFAPMTKEFGDAGLSIVAISSDTADGLRRTLEKASGASPFPFPLLSDQELSVFKAYRAFDDFENTPLHGTFLVDGAGLVRWQDISYEPFKDAKFLLSEAKRLLNLGTKAAAPDVRKEIASKPK